MLFLRLAGQFKIRRTSPQWRSKPTGRGFSLIELLLVVTILGIIAALVVPRVSSSTQRAAEKVRASHVAQLNGAIEQYYLTTGNWPTDLTDLIGTYLVDGVPANPLGGPYSIDATTHRVTFAP